MVCLVLFFLSFFLSPRNAVNGKPSHESRKERSSKRGGGRYEPYANPSKRYRVFVSNIPYDVKWQALKDLMKEKGKTRIYGNGVFLFGGFGFTWDISGLLSVLRILSIVG